MKIVTKTIMLIGVLCLVVGITLIARYTGWVAILGVGLVGFSYGLAWRD